MDKKSNITCCKTTETPIINDKNAPSGCCPNTNLTADKKTCCLSSSQIVGNECCESSKQITIDGKKLCCTGHNILISDAYTIGSITGEEICTEYNGDATFKETAYNAATNSEDCYNIYKKLKSGDLPNFSYIYYNHYNSQCMLGCNKLNSDDHFEPANNLLLTSTSSGPSCKTNICSSDTPVYDPPTSSGNNFIFEDKNGIEYWTKPANINASTLTYKVQKTVTNPDNGDCNQSIGNNEACEEVLGNGFETEDYDTGNTTCTGTLMSTNFKTMICNNSLTPTTDYWINGVYPISFNESNSTYSCTNIAPKWNGQKWDPPTLKCSQANNCQFLSNGKYCINGSYDGKTCLQTTVTTTSACREFSGSLSSLSSYIKCTNPDGDTRTSPIYYCGSYSTDPTDPIKGFDPICTGNGIINQNEPYTVTCKGYFNLDSSSNQCIKPILCPILDLSASFNWFGSVGHSLTHYTNVNTYPPTSDSDTRSGRVNQGNTLQTLSPYTRTDLKNGDFTTSHKSVLLLSPSVTTIGGGQKLYVNTRPDATTNTTTLLCLNYGISPLNLFYIIQPYSIWSTDYMESSSVASALCYFDNTTNEYHRLIYDYNGDASLNNYATSNTSNQNTSQYSGYCSIVPIYINNTSPPQFVLGALQTGGYAPDQAPFIDTYNNKLYLASIVTSGTDVNLEFTENITINYNDQIVLNSETATKSNGANNVQITKDTAVFNVELQSEVNGAEADTFSVIKAIVSANLTIGAIISNYQKYGSYLVQGS